MLCWSNENERQQYQISHTTKSQSTAWKLLFAKILQMIDSLTELSYWRKTLKIPWKPSDVKYVCHWPKILDLAHKSESTWKSWGVYMENWRGFRAIVDCIFRVNYLESINIDCMFRVHISAKKLNQIGMIFHNSDEFKKFPAKPIKWMMHMRRGVTKMIQFECLHLKWSLLKSFSPHSSCSRQSRLCHL